MCLYLLELVYISSYTFYLCVPIVYLLCTSELLH